MKKFFLFSMMCLMALSMQAQRCAVLEFRAGTGVAQSQVEGLSDMFLTYFHPTGYTLVERTQIDRVIAEQGFQHSRLTENQMVRIGEILNVTKIVTGTVNIVNNQYNVDVRAIDVETGVVAATEGATFATTNYRSNIQSLASKLSSKIIAITTNNQSTNTLAYIDLGLPSGTRWRNTNAAGYYSYDEAISQFGDRLPSKKQWEELRAECIWTWTGSGYSITGPNGNSIVLPYEQNKYYEYHSYYWSSTPYGSSSAWFLSFNQYEVEWVKNGTEIKNSVRLVQSK